jgi:hypothetical protein
MEMVICGIDMVYRGSDDDCEVMLLLWDGEMMDCGEDDVF